MKDIQAAHPNVKVVTANDGKNTTVTVTNKNNLTQTDGTFSYTASDGKNYQFQKVGDNQYLYSVTSGDTTTNYTVTVIDGNITNKNNLRNSICINYYHYYYPIMDNYFIININLILLQK